MSMHRTTIVGALAATAAVCQAESMRLNDLIMRQTELANGNDRLDTEPNYFRPKESAYYSHHRAPEYADHRPYDDHYRREAGPYGRRHAMMNLIEEAEENDLFEPLAGSYVGEDCPLGYTRVGCCKCVLDKTSHHEGHLGDGSEFEVASHDQDVLFGDHGMAGHMESHTTFYTSSHHAFGNNDSSGHGAANESPDSDYDQY